VQRGAGTMQCASMETALWFTSATFGNTASWGFLNAFLSTVDEAEFETKI